MASGKYVAGLLAVFLVISPLCFFPLSLGNLQSPPVDPPPTSHPISAPDAALGPSVDISYQVQEKTFNEVEFFSTIAVDYYYENPDGGPFQLLLDDGNQYGYTCGDANNGLFDFGVKFKIFSPYTSLTGVKYDFKGDVTGNTSALEDFSCNLLIYKPGGYDNAEVTLENYDKKGTLTLSSVHVTDSYIYGSFSCLSQDDDNAQDTYQLIVDVLAFEYAAVTETRRSTYTVQGGTVLYTVDWTTWTHQVNTTLSVPAAWTFRDVNPDCTESSGTFSCLVPEDYQATYTQAVLATANWQPFFTDSFESGYTHNWTEGLDTSVLEYTIVMDGGVSVKGITAAGGELKARVPDGTYIWAASIYIVAGTVHFYAYDGSSWNWLGACSTAGKWETKMVNATLAGISSDRNLAFSFAAGTTAYVDACYLYESSVETGQIITGTYHHIHPNGYVPAAFFTMEYACTTWFPTYTDKQVSSDGTWSINTGSWTKTSSTQQFKTRNPDDTTNDLSTDYITYPWTYDNLQFDQFSFNMDDWYVHLTVYTNLRNTSVTITDYHDGTNTTKFAAQPEGSFSYRFEEWGDHTLYVECTWNASKISVTKNYEARRDYPDEPLEGTPPEVTFNLSMIALFTLMTLIGVIAFGLYWRKSRQQDFIISAPGTNEPRQKGRLKVQEPYTQRRYKK